MLQCPRRLQQAPALGWCRIAPRLSPSCSKPAPGRVFGEVPAPSLGKRGALFCFSFRPWGENEAPTLSPTRLCFLSVVIVCPIPARKLAWRGKRFFLAPSPVFVQNIGPAG